MITVITPTIPGRERQLWQCHRSVTALGLKHLIEVDTEHAGPATIRNHLVEHVRTDWTLFLDDDDLLYPNYIDIVAPHLTDADIVYTSWRLTGATDPQPPPTFDPDLLRERNTIPITACVRTAAFRAVGGFRSDVELEDHALWLSLLDAGFRFRYIPVMAWHYRRSSGSRTERQGG